MSDSKEQKSEVKPETEAAEGSATEGTVEDNSGDNLNSAKEHLSAAFHDLMRFCDEDLPKMSSNVAGKVEKAAQEGVSAAASRLIKVLEDIKKKVNSD